MDKEFAVENDRALEELVERANNGEKIILTRAGKPVAEIVASGVTTNRKAVRAAHDWIRDARRVDLGMSISDAIHTGRKY